MGEAKGYLCDGCGVERLVLDGRDVLDSVTRHGWFHVLTPAGWPALYACSAACVVRAVEQEARALLPEVRR